jgi:hypothetical protein
VKGLSSEFYKEKAAAGNTALEEVEIKNIYYEGVRQPVLYDEGRNGHDKNKGRNGCY